MLCKYPQLYCRTNVTKYCVWNKLGVLIYCCQVCTTWDLNVGHMLIPRWTDPVLFHASLVSRKGCSVCGWDVHLSSEMTPASVMVKCVHASGLSQFIRLPALLWAPRGWQVAWETDQCNWALVVFSETISQFGWSGKSTQGWPGGWLFKCQSGLAQRDLLRTNLSKYLWDFCRKHGVATAKLVSIWAAAEFPS